MTTPSALSRNFILYAVIGAGAFLSDYAVFIGVLHAIGNPYVANIVGICTGIVVSFSLNRKLNFRKLDIPGRRSLRFVAVATLGMAVSSLVIMLLLGLNIDARIAKVIAMSIVFAMQFLINAAWTFR